MSRLQISSSGSSPRTAWRFHLTTAIQRVATWLLLLLLFLCDAAAIRSQSAATDAAASGDTGRAIAHLEHALTLDPLYPPAASALMSLYQKEGNTAEADALAGKINATMDEAPAAASAAPQSSPGESGKTAEQVYKNIEILKGVPAGQVIPAMQFITASLGVECSYCHVEGHLEKDDKKPKQVARDMMQMMFALNKNNFEGHREVTCYSCHRGAPNPLTIPLVGGESQLTTAATSASPAAPDADADSAAPKLPVNLPTVSRLLENYVRALGGSAAIEKISTRVERGSTTFHGQSLNVEIFTQAPNEQSIVRHSPGGDNVTTFDGQTGWSIAPNRPPRAWTPTCNSPCTSSKYSLSCAWNIPKK
jgi:hypothetical protein